MHYSPSTARLKLLSQHTRLTHVHGSIRSLRIIAALTCYLFAATVAVTFSGGTSFAKGVNLSTYQGVILQVDKTNSADVTFSLLDRGGNATTFHLTSSTQFAQHQSASQLKVNLFAIVKAKPNTGATGTLNAVWLLLQGRNQAPLTIQGVVTASDANQNIVTLALSDGTILTVSLPHTAITSIQTGSTIALNASFTASGSLAASRYRVITAHASHFRARGIISHLNTRVHLVTLVSPVGSAFSFKQSLSTASNLHLGEKITINGSSDNNGNLTMQAASVDNTNEQFLTVIGMVRSIDTTANTFSLVDKAGNSSTINATSDLLASLQVGGVYQLEVSIASDGSLTAIKIISSAGTNRGKTLSLEGTIQFYDATSGLLNISTDDGQSISLQISNQTTIVNTDGTAGVLASGQAIHAAVQLHVDGSYAVLKIEIQDSVSISDKMTFAGLFLFYDDTTGTLTISPAVDRRLSFATNNDTEVDGAASLDGIPSWFFVKVTVQVQSDGSYLATKVQVPNNFGDDHHHGRSTK